LNSLNLLKTNVCNWNLGLIYGGRELSDWGITQIYKCVVAAQMI